MSAYTNFYIKNDEDYIAIGSYTRSSKVAEVFNKLAPWDEGRLLTPHLLDITRDSCKEEITEIDTNIRTLESRKSDVYHFNNTADEKVEALQLIEGDIIEWQKEKDEYLWVLHYCQFLNDILDPYMNKEIEILFGVEFYPVDYDD